MNLEEKSKSNSELGLALSKNAQFVNPLTSAKMSSQTCVEVLALVREHPESFLRKSSFDGLGEWVKTEELEGTTAYLFDCEILDYDAKDSLTNDLKHYHYSVWLGVRESDGLSFIYSAGSKLTSLAELLLNGENESVLNAVREKGMHVKFPKLRRLANGHSFMDAQLIP